MFTLSFFQFKKRICKHIAQMLQARMFNLVKPSRSAGCKGVNGYRCGEEVSSEGYCGDCLDWLVDQAKEAECEAHFDDNDLIEISTNIF